MVLITVWRKDLKEGGWDLSQKRDAKPPLPKAGGVRTDELPRDTGESAEVELSCPRPWSESQPHTEDRRPHRAARSPVRGGGLAEAGGPADGARVTRTRQERERGFQASETRGRTRGARPAREESSPGRGGWGGSFPKSSRVAFSSICGAGTARAFHGAQGEFACVRTTLVLDRRGPAPPTPVRGPPWRSPLRGPVLLSRPQRRVLRAWPTSKESMGSFPLGSDG